MNPELAHEPGPVPPRLRLGHDQIMELAWGETTIGRADGNGLQLDHPTISDVHCKLEVTEANVWVEDLGSTNGTFVDGELVQRSVLRRGQTLRLGEVELTFEAAQGTEPAPELAAAPEPDDETAPLCCNHGGSPATWICVQCRRAFCGACVRLVRVPSHGPTAICNACQGLCRRWQSPALRPKSITFAEGLIGALTYPARGDGPFMLIGAAFLYTVVDLLGRWTAVSWVVALVGLVIGAYVTVFLRDVVLSAAAGEHKIPAWPDFQKDNLLETVIQFFVPYLISFGPWMVLRLWVRPDNEGMQWLTYGFLGLGLAYFPMALLAVIVFDNVGAVNPIVVVLSILKAPLRYFAVCAVFGVSAAAMLLLDRAVTALGVPLIGSALSTLTSLYAALVGMRAIGWFYFCHQEKLGWH